MTLIHTGGLNTTATHPCYAYTIDRLVLLLTLLTPMCLFPFFLLLHSPGNYQLTRAVTGRVGGWELEVEMNGVVRGDHAHIIVVFNPYDPQDEGNVVQRSCATVQTDVLTSSWQYIYPIPRPSELTLRIRRVGCGKVPLTITKQPHGTTLR